ncbi:hypothetical protein OCAE111667_14955 [Occultella aeris]|uniref:Uncharacterized protein n=1 Tax=Occultella aeris TaxID=2761496 RepID=A0A7M4DET6_9MICO|nr:hypothetical protein [Occultella aeris]VZO35429.1 hypothetical protein HALOF300_00627 [Occultella aeris]
MGTAVIHWDGYHDGDVADRLGPIPEIATLHVAERTRSRGVGTGTDHTATETDRAMVKILGAQRLPIPRREG